MRDRDLSNKRTPWIVTYSGQAFFILDPGPDEIRLIDIAVPLGRICRFGAHTLFHYSVAEHSVFASSVVEVMGGTVEEQRWALFHDAAEAYYGDVVRPLKCALSDYRQLETRGMIAIAERFGFGWPEPPIVKQADLIMLWVERTNGVVADGPRPWSCEGVEPPPEIVELLQDETLGEEPGDASRLWLRRCESLGIDMDGVDIRGLTP